MLRLCTAVRIRSGALRRPCTRVHGEITWRGVRGMASSQLWSIDSTVAQGLNGAFEADGRHPYGHRNPRCPRLGHL